jgi:hypothetical protein
MKHYTIENHPEFKDREQILVDFGQFGFPGRVETGKVVGKSTSYIIDYWMVEFPFVISDYYKFKVLNIPHTSIIVKEKS